VSARGRPFWARVVGTVEHQDGEPIRLYGAFQDVTVRKAIEKERDKSRDLLQVTLDSIGDAVITTDTEGRVQWLNPVAERMTGWLKAEAMGKPLLQVFVILHEETREPAEDPVRQCLSQGKIVGLARGTVLVSRDGTEYGIEDSASPIRDVDGLGHGAVLVFHDVSEQRRLSREMTRRASHDQLTGLVNRSEFEARLGRLFAALKQENSNNALLYIDLDQFKLVNDACGHSVGDDLLKQVSALLRHAVRQRDTVARLGGDEFGIILERCDMAQGKKTAQKICDQMEEFRFLHDGRRFRVGASIGLVPVDRRWSNMAQVLQAADTSCYAAKEAGRNRVHVWFDTDRAMKARKGEMQWASRLEQALDEDRFELHGQRIEAIAPSARAEGLHCEILLRLREHDGTLIPPGAFLPAAERFNMATRIDRWVVRRTFDWMERAAREGREIAMIAINLSGHSIGDRAFHRDVREMVAHAGFEVRHLCFEITETAAITNFSDAKVFIGEMRSLGVKIALDDFGAGASSFGYLKSLPVDYLKIDGQFIIDLLDDALDNAAVRCFREVAEVVGVTTIAECVERRDVHQALREIGIDMAQGYLIHRPEPLENIFVTATTDEPRAMAAAAPASRR
jgi:diguanylate cyclase (GGDEF)-like protein/PAS domain S-box-containing protein